MRGRKLRGPDEDSERAAKTWRRLAETLMNVEIGLDEAVEAIGKAWELVATTGSSKTRAWVLATRAALQRALDQHDEAAWSARTAVSDARAAGSAGAEASALKQVALGRTNREAGQELFISEKTVSVHLSRVMAKLGAARRAEAVAIAYDRGLLTKPVAS